MLKLREDFTAQLDFGQSAQDERDAAPIDFSGKNALGACPKCGARVFDHELAYVCERAVGPGRTCDFRSGKIILQRAIEPEQMVKLLATGRTDLLHRFISKKGRPFSAFLVRQPDGRVGFEFAPRAAKPGTAKAPAAAAKARTRPAGSTAREPAPERNVYALTPPKGKPVPPPVAKRTPPRAARVAAKRGAGAKKTVRKTAPRKPAAAKKQKRAA
jgi:DNA topoisomerase-3